MRKALIKVSNIAAGTLQEAEFNKKYSFHYLDKYQGQAVSLTMPIGKKEFYFDEFPPFFDGLLPEGAQLEALLKQKKINKDDLFAQLIAVGSDLVGTTTVELINE